MKNSLSILLFSSIALCSVNADPWTYPLENLWPKCGGFYQSPIDVVFSEVVAIAFDALLFENIGPLYLIDLHNNGRYVTGHLVGPLSRPAVRIGNGPRYKFDHFRFHWRYNGAPSSENSFNGQHFYCEFHYVFINENYLDFDEASNHPDGLLIISVVCIIDELIDASLLTALVSAVQAIVNFDSYAYAVDVPLFDFIEDLLSPDSNHHYFKYRGSLTTPPCADADIILLKNPQHIRRYEYDFFLPLRDENNLPIYTN
ncbi:carbonic anhydrase 6-like, partial [Musca vetustissima]|uniref:carbonic anhydrase 6-like n=1 Tax=Musca vetustissima TaxID=27455 RepID=UPI002AB7641F